MQVEDFQTIVTKLQENTRTNIQDLNVENTSIWYQVIGAPTALAIDRINQKILELYDRMNPFTAEGIDLDNILGNVNIVRRQPSKASGVWKTTTATPFTVVGIGDLVLEKADGTTYKNITKTIIESDGTGIFNVEATEAGTIGNALANEVTKIKIPIQGVINGTNEQPFTGGQDKETDFELIQRWQNTDSIDSYWNIDGIRLELLKQNGVSSVFVGVNNTNTTDSNGWLAHSLTCVVAGGTDLDIANSIFKKSDGSIYKNGDVSVIVKDVNGNEHEIKFYRPNEISIDSRYSIDGTVDTGALQTALKEYVDNVTLGGLISSTKAWEYIRTKVDIKGVNHYEIDFRKTGTADYKSTYQLNFNEKAIAKVVAI